MRKTCLPLSCCLAVLCVAAAVFCNAPAARADRLPEVPLDLDSYIDQGSPTGPSSSTNSTISVIVNSLGHGGTVTRGLVRETPPAIPEDQVLSSAKLWMYLYYERYSGPGVRLYPLEAPFDGTSTWNSLGGGTYNASGSSAAMQKSSSPPEGRPAADAGAWWCSWDITSLWNDSNFRSNGGILVLDPESCPLPGDWYTEKFRSTDYSGSSYRPFVEVVTVPEPSTIVLLVAGMGLLAAGLLKRWRAEPADDRRA